MGLFDSLFGKKSSGEKIEPKRSDSPLGIIVVFAKQGSYDTTALESALGRLFAGLQSISVEALPGTVEQGTPLHRVSWADHMVDIVGMNAPLPKGPLENCVQAAHYSQEIKAAVRANQAHAILYYSGSNEVPLERYVALSAVSAGFATLGGVGVLHEAAMTSLPAVTVYKLATAKPEFAMLRHLPLLMLFCGFVKYFLPDKQTAWMRTYNCPAFGVPDFAVKARIDQSEKMFELFQGIAAYLLDSGAKFKPGHTPEFGEVKLRFRAPRDDEPFPTDTKGQLLIAEIAA